MLKTKTDKLLLFALIVGSCSSMIPSVAIGYGIAQFKFVAIAGKEGAVSAFSHSQGLVTLFMIGLIPLLGRVVDRFPFPNGTRYYWTLLGNSVGLLSLHWFAQAETEGQIILAWVGVLLSYSLSGSAFKAAIPELIPPDRLSVDSGLIGAAIPLCLAVNLILVLGLFAESSIAMKLYMMGALQLILSIVGMLIISSYHRHRAREKALDVQAGKENKSYVKFALIVIAKVFLNIAISGTSLLTLYYTTRFAMAQSDVFTLNAIMSLGVILILITGGGAVYFAKRYRRSRTLLALGTLLISCGLLGYAIAEELWVAIVAGVFIQLGLGPVSALSMAMVNRALPNRKHYARDIAIADTAHNIGAATIHFAAPVIIAAGAGITHSDGYSLYFYCLLAFSLLFIGMLWLIQEEN